MAYVFSGVCAALAGLFLLSRTGVGDPSVAEGMDFQSIVAVALGGISLYGGKGSMIAEYPKSVISSGGRYVLTDNTETPDSQIAVFEFPSYRMIFEHQVGNNLGPDRREHGVAFTGTDATLILDEGGWEVIPERTKKDAPSEKHTARQDDQARVNHAGNFLECMRSRKPTVENFEIGHHVSTVAHLGNLAFRTSGARGVGRGQRQSGGQRGGAEAGEPAVPRAVGAAVSKRVAR